MWFVSHLTFKARPGVLAMRPRCHIKNSMAQSCEFTWFFFLCFL